MYLTFYNLKQKPFQISTDPKFLWLGEKHEEALATLKYGVLDNKGFLLLTGNVGTGKTTLINALLRTLGKNTLVATVRDPALEPIDFYNYTAYAFRMEGNFTSKGSFLIQFERFLLNAHKAKKKVLLIIDEAQRITQELLEEVRLLSNIEKEDTKLLNIFFVGQSEFNDILLQPENRPIRQRITVNYNIRALNNKETRAYIRHRLKIAGAKATIFDEGALYEIFSFSEGYPRLINIICDRALLTGFVEETRIITSKQVKECANELTIPRTIHSTITRKRYENEKNVSTEPISKNTVAQTSRSDQENKLNFSVRISIACTILFLLLCVLIYFNSGIVYRGERALSNFLHDTWGKPETVPEEKSKIEEQSKLYDLEARQKEQKKQIDNRAITLESTQPSMQKTNAENTLKVKKKVTPDQTVQTESTRTSSVQETSPNSQEQISADDNRVITSDDIRIISKFSESTSDNTESNKKKQVADQKAQVKKQVTFEKLIIPFPSNSNFPHLDSLKQLHLLVEALLSQPEYIIIVAGYTDSLGNEAYNVKLSEFRANAVKGYLVGRGIEESRIHIIGFGSQNPIASNDTLTGRMANRRVEIQVERQSSLRIN